MSEPAAPQVFKVAIDLVHPNPQNPRTIRDASFKKLVKSLREFPQMLYKRPPVVVTLEDGSGYMALGGNKRTEAAKAAGYSDIPIMLADDWDKDQRARFILLDNDNAGDWDFAMLTQHYSLDVIMDLTSIQVPSNLMRGNNGLQDGFDPGTIEEVQTDIVPGTLVEIGPHRLVCGNNADPVLVDRLMDGRLAHLVVTDPPYGVDYVGKTKAQHVVHNDGRKTLPNILAGAFTQYMRVVRPGCPLYITGPAGPNMFVFGSEITKAGFEIRQTMAWVKDSAVMGHSDYHYRHEAVILAYKKDGANGRLGRGGPHWNGGNNQNTVFEFPRPHRNADHATEKPVDLFALFMRNHSAEGDIVLDLFSGGGTTMVAAHSLGRVAFCQELSPQYCQSTVNRMLALDPGLRVVKHLP